MAASFGMEELKINEGVRQVVSSHVSTLGLPEFDADSVRLCDAGIRVGHVEVGGQARDLHFAAERLD